MSPASRVYDEIVRDLPLLCPTPPAWAEIAAADLPTFLADHGVCEQQAALTALNLVAHYPEDGELARRMTAEAGFRSFETRDFGHPLNAYYEVRP